MVSYTFVMVRHAEARVASPGRSLKNHPEGRPCHFVRDLGLMWHAIPLNGFIILMDSKIGRILFLSSHRIEYHSGGPLGFHGL
jgi:hypothetical protein